MRQRAKFTQALDIDDGAAMNPYKLLGIKLPLEMVHRLPHAVRLRSAMDDHVIGSRAKAIDLLDFLKEDAVPIAQRQALHISRRGGRDRRLESIPVLDRR